MRGKRVPGKRVMILDGDGHFMGLALVELMVNHGKEVTNLCDAADVAEYGVKTYCGHWVDRIGAGNVRVSYLYEFGPDLLGPTSGAVPHKLKRPAPVLGDTRVNVEASK